MVAIECLSDLYLLYKIAVGNGRLYFITGHWPVVGGRVVGICNPNPDADVAEIVFVKAFRFSGGNSSTRIRESNSTMIENLFHEDSRQ